MDRLQIFYILLGNLTFFTGSFSVAKNNILSETTWCSIKWKKKEKKVFKGVHKYIASIAVYWFTYLGCLKWNWNR